MASLEGFEPPTGRLEGGCSILLSYRDVYAQERLQASRLGRAGWVTRLVRTL